MSFVRPRVVTTLTDAALCRRCLAAKTGLSPSELDEGQLSAIVREARARTDDMVSAAQQLVYASALAVRLSRQHVARSHALIGMVKQGFSARAGVGDAAPSGSDAAPRLTAP